MSATRCVHQLGGGMTEERDAALDWFLRRMDCDVRGWFAIDNPRAYFAMYGCLPASLSNATFREVFEAKGSERPHLTLSVRKA